MAVTTIDADAGVLTLINVFTVEPSRQRELADLLADATEQVMRHRQGFVAANLHVSHDGTRVANYAQWESRQDYDAMLADPRCREHRGAAWELATCEPVLYEVDSVHRR